MFDSPLGGRISFLRIILSLSKKRISMLLTYLVISAHGEDGLTTCSVLGLVIKIAFITSHYLEKEVLVIFDLPPEFFASSQPWP